MSFGLDGQLDDMRGALRLLLAHLNGLRPPQWDWKPSASCRSIREILRHMSETYEGRAALERELARPAPDVAQVQALFGAAAEGDYARLRRRYLGTPLARRAWEECCHAGQVVYIRLATDPEWDQEGEVYGLRPGPGEDDA